MHKEPHFGHWIVSVMCLESPSVGSMEGCEMHGDLASPTESFLCIRCLGAEAHNASWRKSSMPSWCLCSCTNHCTVVTPTPRQLPSAAQQRFVMLCAMRSAGGCACGFGTFVALVDHSRRPQNAAVADLDLARFKFRPVSSMAAALTAQQAKRAYMGAEVIKDFPGHGLFAGKVFRIDINVPDGDVVWPLLYKIKCDWGKHKQRRCQGLSCLPAAAAACRLAFAFCGASCP